MDKIAQFKAEHDEIVKLDHTREAISMQMYGQYQRRNSFGVDRNKEIHRIFQKEFYDRDIKDQTLTLPLAEAGITWNDPLENPLANVKTIDIVTRKEILLGSLVQQFYALCWTERPTATKKDWKSFSHRKPAVRISTTIGKLLDRLMHPDDPYYMLRYWVIRVDYKDPTLIQAMQNPDEVYQRMETTGAMLALSAAVIRTQYSDQKEIRLLFDASINPQQQNVTYQEAPKLVRIPFDWNGFVDKEI